MMAKRRYWNVVLEGKIVGDPFGQYGMLPVSVLAETAEEAERVALEQENDPEVVTELKVLFTRPD